MKIFQNYKINDDIQYTTLNVITFMNIRIQLNSI